MVGDDDENQNLTAKENQRKKERSRSVDGIKLPWQTSSALDPKRRRKRR